MMSLATLVGLIAFAPVADLPTAFWQAAPATRSGEPLRRQRDRAVLLIHGYVPRPLRTARVAEPGARSWQKPGSELVRRLAADFDVFGFSYAQSIPVDAIARSPGLRRAVGQLKRAGYTNIVLIGHSAGGVVARRFVEQFPDVGVTKVITIAAPHEGVAWARALLLGLPGGQVPFVRSLGVPARRAVAAKCGPLGRDIQFCCVVCVLPRLGSDTIVSTTSQWPTELQKQGIPASVIRANHFDAMKAAHATRVIAELARDKLARWTPKQVEQGRRALFQHDAGSESKK
jgi:pimeloyl-ACP methyl ester carboxylesterase